MKKNIINVLAVILLLSLVACGKNEKSPEVNTTTPESESKPESEVKVESKDETMPEPFAGEYVKILMSGNYQYGYIVPYEGIEMTTTEAAKDSSSVYRVAMGESGSRIIKQDGRYYAIEDKTGKMVETTAEKTWVET